MGLVFGCIETLQCGGSESERTVVGENPVLLDDVCAAWQTVEEELAVGIVDGAVVSDAALPAVARQLRL